MLHPHYSVGSLDRLDISGNTMDMFEGGIDDQSEDSIRFWLPERFHAEFPSPSLGQVSKELGAVPLPKLNEGQASGFAWGRVPKDAGCGDVSLRIPGECTVGNSQNSMGGIYLPRTLAHFGTFMDIWILFGKPLTWPQQNTARRKRKHLDVSLCKSTRRLSFTHVKILGLGPFFMCGHG